MKLYYEKRHVWSITLESGNTQTHKHLVKTIRPPQGTIILRKLLQVSLTWLYFLISETNPLLWNRLCGRGRLIR